MQYDDVPGWLSPVDQAAFSWILRFQESEPPGALVELGVFKGRSAIHIGHHVRDAEVFTVCDLFEHVATSEAVDPRERDFLRSQGLSQHLFEDNYLAFHRTLPRIVCAPTSLITRHVAPRTARFVHVDAGHSQALVRGDLESARVMLRNGGVVVINDYRKAETPGVAAAVWECILLHGLRPFLTTQNKLYATWSDPAAVRDEMARRAADTDWCAIRRDIAVADTLVHYLHRKA